MEVACRVAEKSSETNTNKQHNGQHTEHKMSQTVNQKYDKKKETHVDGSEVEKPLVIEELEEE